jgi:hypothetical protein
MRYLPFLGLQIVLDKRLCLRELVVLDWLPNRTHTRTSGSPDTFQEDTSCERSDDNGNSSHTQLLLGLLHIHKKHHMIVRQVATYWAVTKPAQVLVVLPASLILVFFFASNCCSLLECPTWPQQRRVLVSMQLQEHRPRYFWHLPLSLYSGGASEIACGCSKIDSSAPSLDWFYLRQNFVTA